MMMVPVKNQKSRRNIQTTRFCNTRELGENQKVIMQYARQ